MFNKRPGFTMMEVLVVVAIVAVLSVLLYPLLIGQIYKGRDARRKSDLDIISKAIEQYYTDKDCYPSALPLCTPGDGLRPYLSKIPCDPQTGSNYEYYIDPNTTSCPTWFWLFANLDTPEDKQSKDIGCYPSCGSTEETTYYEYYSSSSNAPQPYIGTGTETEPPLATCSSEFYGCFSGVCKALCAPGGDPECSINYTSPDCFSRCGTPSNPKNECT